MRIQHYYLVSRVRCRGGLSIIRTDEDFPPACEEEIKEQCMEICVPTYDRNAVMIYPLENGMILTALARKVKGTVWEEREHEDIHGYIMSVEDFSSQVLPQVAVDLEACFYHWDIEEAETLSEENLKFQTPGEMEPAESYLDQLPGEARIDFFYSVYQTIITGDKVHLVVPEGESRRVQAACYEILPYELRKQLYTITGGECPQSQADIILTEKDAEVLYSKFNRSMDLPAFLKRGQAFRRKDLKFFNKCLCERSKERTEIYAFITGIFWTEIEEQENRPLFPSVEWYDLLQEMLICREAGEVYSQELFQKVKNIQESVVRDWIFSNFPSFVRIREEEERECQLRERNAERIEQCRAYIQGRNEIPFVMNRIRESFHESDGEREWEIFQQELRQELGGISLKKEESKRYMQVLFLAYENYGGRLICQEPSELLSPYDLSGLLLFLKNKSRSEWSYKKMVKEAQRQYINGIFPSIRVEKETSRQVLEEKYGIE